MAQQRCVSVISWHLHMSLLGRLHTRHQLRKNKQTTLVQSHHTKEHTRENIKAKEKEEASITFPDAVFFCRNKYDSNKLSVLPTAVNPD